MLTYEQAIGIVRRGGIISRVGVPQYEEAPIGFGGLFRHDLRLAAWPRTYIEELMPDILDGVPAAYQDMADRKSLKVLIKM